MSYLSRCNFDVLFLKGTHYIWSSQAAAGHADGIQPHAHGIFALSEDEDVGHAGHAFQSVFYVHIQVVAHEERIVAAVLRIDCRAEHEIIRSLGDADAGGLDGAGKTSLRGVDTVLDVHSGQVGIAVQIECGHDRTYAVVAAGGGEILHSLGTIDLLFQRGGDCGLHRLRAGADIGADDRYLRRCQAGKLRDGQGRNHHGAGQNDQ